MNILKKTLMLLVLGVHAEAMFAQQVYTSDKHDFQIEEVAKGLQRPWAMAFLPNGDMLITERTGSLRIIRQGQLDAKHITGLPENIYSAGQGGLLDIALHPQFEKNKLVYFSYAGSGEGGAGTEVARAEFDGEVLTNLEKIFIVEPKTPGQHHYGSRLVFAADGTLFITTGDRYNRLHDAQDPSNHLGTIIRINDDGSVPEDNPFVNHSKYKSEVYSYGHRNAQGIALRPQDQSIWSHEHGPRGGDEVNKLIAGANYGWPAITYGIDYSGAIISDKTHAPGMEQPIVYWDPSIAPCGMTFYQGDKFPRWQGDIFVGALAKKHLRRLKLIDDKVVEQEVLLKDIGRVRDVRTGPQGFLYVLTDSNNGSLFKLIPAHSGVD